MRCIRRWLRQQHAIALSHTTLPLGEAFRSVDFVYFALCIQATAHEDVCAQRPGMPHLNTGFEKLQEKQQPSGSVQWACDFCYAKFPSLEAATTHEATCSKRFGKAEGAAFEEPNGGPVECAFCHDVFASRDATRKHESTCSFRPPSLAGKPWAPGVGGNE